MLKIGVIGLGEVSKVHISNIQHNPDARLVAVCDGDETLKNKVNEGNFYISYNEMLEKETLDCVHICLPHYLHYSVTKACVEKGIHVYQEKPLALNMDESTALVHLEESYQNTKICISLQNRFNETFEKLLDMIQTGEYGQVTGIKGLLTWYRPQSYYDEKPWRSHMNTAGGGVMINQAIHTLDLMQLVGGKIQSINGTLNNLLDYGYEVEDTAAANIQFTNGARGLFFATNANTTNSSIELQVVLEKAKLTIKDGILTIRHKDNVKERIVEDAKLPGEKFYYGPGHTKLINQFYNCIERDTNNYVHAKDAMVSMEMIDAIRSSSQSQEVVYLYEAEDKTV